MSSESLRGIEGHAHGALDASQDHGLLHATVALDGELTDEDGRGLPGRGVPAGAAT